MWRQICNAFVFGTESKFFSLVYVLENVWRLPDIDLSPAYILGATYIFGVFSVVVITLLRCFTVVRCIRRLIQIISLATGARIILFLRQVIFSVCIVCEFTIKMSRVSIVVHRRTYHTTTSPANMSDFPPKEPLRMKDCITITGISKSEAELSCNHKLPSKKILMCNIIWRNKKNTSKIYLIIISGWPR